MKALLFGSIGSVVETSEMQRGAFNAAFTAHGLDWVWDAEMYRRRLASSGGRARIEAYANEQGIEVDAGAIHATKSRLFAERLASDPPELRPGVVESLRLARELGLGTGLASTTLRETVDLILDARGGELRGLVDLAGSAEDGHPQKPAPDIYRDMAARLDIAPTQMLVVEDNAAGLAAAGAAGARVIAYLGANTSDHDISAAEWSARDDVFPVVLGALTAQARLAG